MSYSTRRHDIQEARHRCCAGQREMGATRHAGRSFVDRYESEAFGYTGAMPSGCGYTLEIRQGPSLTITTTATAQPLR
jgi:hypothetical protein